MHTRIKLLLLGLVCFLFFIIGNASLPVTDPVEANYALTAKEMLRHGDWLSPQIYGLYWYDKPIFIYWLLYLSYSLFGITDFAARLPGAFFGAATVVLGAWYLHRQSGRWRPALLLAALLSTSLECWFISHSIITDQPLFFFMCGTLLCAYIALTEGRKGYMTGAYVLAAGAVLTKGPVGLVLPGIFLLVFCLCQRNRVYLRRLFTWQGILLFLLLGGAWYVPMYLVHGQDFINGFLLFNNVTRATVSEHPEYNVWYYYFLLVPLSLLPWSGPCFYGWWRERGRRDAPVYATVWIVGTVLFYTAMATKYPTYSYLADMPLLLFGARALDRLMDRGREKAWFCLTVPTAIFLAGLGHSGTNLSSPHFRPAVLTYVYGLLSNNDRPAGNRTGQKSLSRAAVFGNRRHGRHVYSADPASMCAVLYVSFRRYPHALRESHPRRPLFLSHLSHLFCVLYGPSGDLPDPAGYPGLSRAPGRME